MELKKYNEYTDDEKKELLFHWWHYYGRTVCSLGVMKQFIDMVSSDVEKVFEIGLVSFAKGDNGKGLISAMRDGVVDEYCQEVKDFSDTDAFNDVREEIEKMFLEMLVDSYANKDDYIMTDEEYVNGIMSILDQSNECLSSDRVISLYKECLFKEDELEDTGLALPFTLGQGIRTVGIFNSERLELNKKKVIELVDKLNDIDNVPSFLNLNVDKNGREWTSSQGVMDMLVQLGTATNVLVCLFVREEDNEVVPMIVRQRSKDNEKVTINQTSELPKVFEKYKIVSN